MTPDSWPRAVARDGRLALRLLRARPAFAAVALVTLALGIGAPTAIFSVVHAVLIQPLPYPDADRLVEFRIEAHGPRGNVSFDALPVSAALEWRDGTQTLAGLGVFNDVALTLSTADGPYRLNGVSATPDVLRLLGAAPEAGQLLDAANTDRHQILLSHAMWQRYFAKNPATVGSAILLDGEAYRVTGVMPEAFAFPTPEASFWVPLPIDAGGGRGMLLPALARLRPGATVQAVVEEGRRFVGSMGDAREQTNLIAVTLQEQLVGGVRRTLWLLMAAVSLVSIVATVNLALLLLTRGAGREREFSIRLALGATRGQLVRQLVVEAGTLAVVGGGAGLVMAASLLAVLVRTAPAGVPHLRDAALDGPVLAFALAATIGATFVFGILSVGRTVAIDPVRALAGTSESRLIRSAPSRRRLHALSAAELAVTMVLLVGASALLRSFVGQLLVPQGFNATGALAMSVNMPASRYPATAARLAFEARLLDRIRQAGLVTSAGFITAMPNRQPTGRFAYDPDSLPDVSDPFTLKVAEVRMATEGFFEAMGIPLKAGRTFRAEDTAGTEPVMVISESLARQHFPNANPIGRLLYSQTGTRRVVGVVGDVRPIAPGPQPSPSAYLPVRQASDGLSWLTSATIVVRGGDRGRLETAMRGLILSLDPEMPPANVRWLDDEIANLTAAPRFSASLVGAFAMVALVLAAIGVYGVAAYSAGQRTREIGVRVALGATRGQVQRLMLRDGLIAVAAGLVTGATAASLLSHALAGLLPDLRSADAATMLPLALLLFGAGTLAAYVPARRATRASALDALRQDG